MTPEVIEDKLIVSDEGHPLANGNSAAWEDVEALEAAELDDGATDEAGDDSDMQAAADLGAVSVKSLDDGATEGRGRNGNSPEKQKPEHDFDTTLASPTALLMREASRYRLLRPEEEIDLAKRIERGDLTAKERMANSNLRLVLSIAKNYQGQGLNMDDLVQEGALGLIRAVEKFDWRKGFRFSTYASLWIKQSITRGLANTGSTIRRPAHIFSDLRAIHTAKREIEAQQDGIEATPEQIAARIEREEMDEARVRQLLETEEQRSLTSLNVLVGEEESDELGNFIADGADRADEEAISNVERLNRKELLQDALKLLPKRERLALEMLYGLNGNDPMKKKDIAVALGFSPSQTRTILEKGTETLTGILKPLRESLIN